MAQLTPPPTCRFCSNYATVFQIIANHQVYMCDACANVLKVTEQIEARHSNEQQVKGLAIPHSVQDKKFEALNQCADAAIKNSHSQTQIESLHYLQKITEQIEAMARHSNEQDKKFEALNQRADAAIKNSQTQIEAMARHSNEQDKKFEALNQCADAAIKNSHSQTQIESLHYLQKITEQIEAMARHSNEQDKKFEALNQRADAAIKNSQTQIESLHNRINEQSYILHNRLKEIESLHNCINEQSYILHNRLEAIEQENNKRVDILNKTASLHESIDSLHKSIAALKQKDNELNNELNNELCKSIAALKQKDNELNNDKKINVVNEDMPPVKRPAMAEHPSSANIFDNPLFSNCPSILALPNVYFSKPNDVRLCIFELSSLLFIDKNKCPTINLYKTYPAIASLYRTPFPTPEHIYTCIFELCRVLNYKLTPSSDINIRKLCNVRECFIELCHVIVEKEKSWIINK